MQRRSGTWLAVVLAAVATAALVVLGAQGMSAAGVVRGLLLGPPPDPPLPTRVVLAFAWPEYPYSVSVPPSLVSSRLSALTAAERPAGRPPDPRRFYWTLTVEFGDDTRRWWITRDGPAWLEAAGNDAATALPARAAVPLDARRLLRTLAPYIERLEDQAFGDLVEWPEAHPLFPVGGTARLRDLESRQSLRIHRHRGDAHFDVEPLTADDAATLQAIYGGQWSWKRRAAVLTAGGRSIAASMNGMPHGWGDIDDNDFVGHFCVHVAGSRVHTTWRRDPGHQLMILKAAGRLAETLDTAPPGELVDLVLAALNHHETATLRVALDPADAGPGRRAGPGPVDRWPAGLLADLLAEVRHLTVIDVREEAVDDTAAVVRAAVTVYFHEPDRDQPFPGSLEVRLRRAAPGTPWTVELESLAPLLERRQPAPTAGSTDSRLDPGDGTALAAGADPAHVPPCTPAAAEAPAAAIGRAAQSNIGPISAEKAAPRVNRVDIGPGS